MMGYISEEHHITAGGDMSWNDPGMPLEVGDPALWHGRVVEIESVNMAEQAIVLFTDEGGIVHSYPIGLHELKPLHNAAAGECVLDAVQKAAAPNLTISQKLERIAEIWFAAPEVGDVFERHGELRLKVLSSGLSGCITIQVSVYWSQRGSWGDSEVFFATPEQFRQTYKSEWRPGYQLRARSTDRPDFQGHELLVWT